MEELNFDVNSLASELSGYLEKLTDEQKFAYDQIIGAVSGNMGGRFFLYGQGGCGKTFLWSTISCSIRSKGGIVLNVASSGIDGLLLPNGRTAHSRDILRCSDSYNAHLPFGGKVVVLGKNFRQILPVIPRGSRQDIIQSSINSSYLWHNCKVLKLTKNMRLSLGENSNIQELKNFAEWLLKIGDGLAGNTTDGESIVHIPSDILVKNSETALDDLVDFVYPDKLSNLSVENYFKDRTILAPILNCVTDVNNKMTAGLLTNPNLTCNIMIALRYWMSDKGKAIATTSKKRKHSTPSIPSIYKNYARNPLQDEDKENQQLPSTNPGKFPNLYCELRFSRYRTTKLNIEKKLLLPNDVRRRINGRILELGLPPHKLVVKVGAPVMLLRNIDQTNGLCNGTRMQVSKKGQTLSKVGIYLPRPVFTHGQLYVVLSRVTSKDGLRVLLQDHGHLEDTAR
ncbi:uncharacterized protein LOC107606469 [Arachis ipaensis]|uniref:uncharacterized protein LOC107606469 n=1 Tax=Arachis ipaensis TaxID=130454 RepID=UPI0007AF5D22|nr:uncharacterized protein LOC107606469 [Arachis ipaensis]